MSECRCGKEDCSGSENCQCGESCDCSQPQNFSNSRRPLDMPVVSRGSSGHPVQGQPAFSRNQTGNK